MSNHKHYENTPILPYLYRGNNCNTLIISQGNFAFLTQTFAPCDVPIQSGRSRAAGESLTESHG